MGVLVHFSINPNFSLQKMSDAMEVVHESAHDEAEVIFGTSTDEALAEDYVKITIVATGFEKELTNNENFVNETPAPRAVVRPRLIVGGDYDNNDYLDIPAYMRQQQD
jgi:cell division protein FtsZ